MEYWRGTGISNDCEGYTYLNTEDPIPDVQMDRNKRFNIQQVPQDQSIHLVRVYKDPAEGKPYSIAVNISSIRPDGLLARDRNISGGQRDYSRGQQVQNTYRHRHETI